jgi:hypothetical protein
MLILKGMKLPQEPAASNYLTAFAKKGENQVFLLYMAMQERHPSLSRAGLTRV